MKGGYNLGQMEPGETSGCREAGKTCLSSVVTVAQGEAREIGRQIDTGRAAALRC